MNEENKQKRRKMHPRSAKEKASAVLSVWSGRRTTSQACKEQSVSWGVLNSWEKQALAGMRKALGQQEEPNVEREMGLNRRLEKLLGRTTGPGTADPSVE